MLLPEKGEHFTDFSGIKKDAFVLLNLGYGLNRLMEDSEGDVESRKMAALFREYGEMYEKEVSSRLIRISVVARILDDRLIKANPESAATMFDFEEMLGDDENGESINLRQCFNKVIHASSIDHEMQLPEVYLSGQHQNKKEWHVRIFLMPFCTAVYQWIDHCQHL